MYGLENLNPGNDLRNHLCYGLALIDLIELLGEGWLLNAAGMERYIMNF